MPIKSETVIKTLKDQISDYFESASWEGDAVTVERNTAFPEGIPVGGLVIVRDGDPGAPDESLAQVGPYYYQHSISVEVYVRDANALARDGIYADLISGVSAALESDRSLSGEIFGMSYGFPDSDITEVEGGEDIKSGTITVVVDYETATPI